MDHPEEAERRAGEEVKRAAREAPVDQLGPARAPEDRGHDETIAEEAHRAEGLGEVPGQVRQRRARGRDDRSHLE